MSIQRKLDLKHFIRRSVVLKNYRKLLRTARRVEKEHDLVTGRDAAEQIKAQFRTFKDNVDSATVAVLLKQAEKSIDTLLNLLPDKGEIEKSSKTITMTGVPSWKGSTDPDGDDERGRLGTSWPWERKPEVK